MSVKSIVFAPNHYEDCITFTEPWKTGRTSGESGRLGTIFARVTSEFTCTHHQILLDSQSFWRIINEENPIVFVKSFLYMPVRLSTTRMAVVASLRPYRYIRWMSTHSVSPLCSSVAPQEILVFLNSRCLFANKHCLKEMSPEKDTIRPYGQSKPPSPAALSHKKVT